MKIGLLNNLYAPYNRGGAEKVVERLKNDLSNLGHQVFVVTTTPEETRADNQNHVYYLASNYYYLNQLPLALKFIWQLGNLINLKKQSEIKKIIETEKPDLIISHNLMGLGFLTPKLIKKLGIKYVQVLHDIQLLHPSGLMYYGHEKIINSLSAKIYQLTTRCLFKSPILIVSPSHWLLDLYSQKGFFRNSKKIILRNPQPELATTQPKPTKDDSYFKFLYVGQIEDYKGIMFLLKTFGQIKNGKIKLIIVGDGSQMAKAKTIIQNDKRVTFLGAKDSAGVQEAMSSCQALIMPSLVYENSPNVILEARLANLPVIASNLGGIPELIKDFGGLLFTPNSMVNLKVKMEEIINNYSDYKNHLPTIKTQTINYGQEIINNL
jgi:glycosyltransferase involved in cell wall biosynthesis